MTAASRLGHLDPFAGASGDMILGAAIGAGATPDAILDVLDGLHLEGWKLEAEQVTRGGLTATRARVTTQVEDHPRTWRGIRRLLFDARIPVDVRERSYAVFLRLAQVEAELHGVAVEDVAFHEVGALDSIIDVVGGCAALLLLDLDRLTASPIALGSGTVPTRHGVLPLPAPATLELLRGIPTQQTAVTAELCTPTGAAMLCEWVDAWDPPGDLAVDAVGYGAGARELDDRPNVLRITVGSRPGAKAPRHRERLVELATVVDDLSAELVAEAADELRSAGALDVWTVTAATKKSRLGVALTCLARPSDADDLERHMFTATSTLGVRRRVVERTALARRHHRVEVAGRPVRMKVGHLDGRIVTASPEHDDCRIVAKATQLPVAHVHELAITAFWSAPPTLDTDVGPAPETPIQEAPR